MREFALFLFSDALQKLPQWQRRQSADDTCGIAGQAEIENADLYDELFVKVDNQDITEVFTSLRDASREKHLPAFEKCN